MFEMSASEYLGKIHALLCTTHDATQHCLLGFAIALLERHGLTSSINAVGTPEEANPMLWSARLDLAY